MMICFFFLDVWHSCLTFLKALLDPYQGFAWLFIFPLTSMTTFSNSIPPLSLMAILILPLSLCSPYHQTLFFIFLPGHYALLLSLPLWHQWKREFPLMLFLFLALLISCLAFWEEITPVLYLRYSKLSLERGLVKMSSIYSFVLGSSNLMFFSMTCSLRKWNLIGICFVLECITGFLEVLIALVLSQGIGMGSSYFTCMSSKVCFIQRTWVQHATAAMYFSSIVYKDTDGFFLLNQDTKQSPK